MDRLLSDQELCKAIFYTDEGFLERDDIEYTDELVYRNIYPHRFIPDSSTEIETYITISCTDYRPSGNSFKNGLLGIYMFTHKDNFKTDYGYTRMDFVLSRVEELMNSQRGVGIGELQFYSLNEYVVNEKFQGYALIYKTMDFN